ncbi:MAG: ABC transporter permease subunit [Patescibacteria group bacterium]
MKQTIISILVLFFLWFLLSSLKLVDPFLFPNPALFAKAFFLQFIHGDIYTDLWFTIRRVLLAFMGPLCIGVPLGVILGAHPRAYKYTEFIIDLGKSTSPLAIFPLFLLFFGIGDASKILTAGGSSLFIVIFTIAHGVMHTKRSRILAAEIMGAGRLTVLKSVVYFETLPHIFVGLRIGLTWVLLLIIATEMFVGTSHGLGHLIIDNQITYNVPEVYAAIFTTALLGYLINLIFVFIEKHYLHWIGK